MSSGGPSPTIAARCKSRSFLQHASEPIGPAHLKRPSVRPPTSGDPVKNARSLDLEGMAVRAVYVPSPKHKRGMFINEYGTRVTGKPGLNATAVEEAVEQEPAPPFTMVCPSRWNDRHPRREATDLLRQAIRNGQIGHPVTDGMPQWVWARDPEDMKVVYLAGPRIQF